MWSKARRADWVGEKGRSVEEFERYCLVSALYRMTAAELSAAGTIITVAMSRRSHRRERSRIRLTSLLFVRLLRHH
jgi:hypothetical protein